MLKGVHVVWDDEKGGTIKRNMPTAEKQTDITYWEEPSLTLDQRMKRTGFKNDLMILKEKMARRAKEWNLS